MTSWLTMVESPLDLMERILSRNNLHKTDLTRLTEPLWYVIRMPGGVGGEEA